MTTGNRVAAELAAPMAISAEVARAPKALLHDHLDGGVRTATILELAEQHGYDGLPAGDAESLDSWFRGSADSGSLERYLQTFGHTVAVMQTPSALGRVARECVLDLAADGVVYAESRFAPELHLQRGLTLHEVVESVLAGLAEGQAEAARLGTPIRVVALLTAMRHAATSRHIAEVAVEYRHAGVAGFDIAGAEVGFPPSRHLDAFEYLRRENAHFTIHAGEAFGLPSIWEAIQVCGADRLGHGVRIVDDISVAGRSFTADPEGVLAAELADIEIGPLAAYVRDARIPLEMCPSSNLQTGAAASVALHPITLLKDLRYRVTVNTDNRLMSGTSMSRECQLLVNEAGWSLSDLRWATINALKSSFLPFDQRLAIIDEVVKPGYADLGVTS